MSGGQGYIGSKISLISRSDIRYVGVLHSINSEDSTVALENVHSFGTEGRKGNPSEEIAPSDNVFEFIVFRGSDIKDLQVFEPPAPKPAAPTPQQYPNDPAIMNSNLDNYTPKQQPQQQPTVAANYNQAPYYGQVPPSGILSAAPQDSLAQKPVSAPVESDPLVGAQQSNMASKSREVTSVDVEKLAKSVSGMNVGADKQPGQASKLPGTGEHLIKSNNRGNRNSKINVRYNAHGNQPNSNNNSNNNNRVVVPKSDFDFEGSNAKFDKDHILKEVTHPHDEQNVEADNGEEEEEVVIPPPDDFYDRSKSFFDNISCEAKERQDGIC
ncbi:hypothetical protein NQZ79_g5345 [Umbelopsis isabellina]|nr:hypothetical protein NQZ79_g5345 [Umbelopsis isabellina]